MGGKPSKGTPADQRLKRNKKKAVAKKVMPPTNNPRKLN